ncbi:MAG: FKBP-type peptidyl-prolyl cis-trans isomerase SlyD [Cellvibrionaceae bacterium]|jgi:FKBP-type peptidyl-prolyl cis-trans isomerase SlyD
MKITAGTVTTFHYRLLKDDQELENSIIGEPMAYLHGHKNIIAGLEEAMEGREANDEFTVIVPPEKAYGLRKDNSVQRVPVKHLHNAKKLKSKLKPGMIVHINTEDGAKQARVIKVGRSVVDVDTNHPLAGATLTFEVKIESVREASAEEITHGHAHGVGGHHH